MTITEDEAKAIAAKIFPSISDEVEYGPSWRLAAVRVLKDFAPFIEHHNWCLYVQGVIGGYDNPPACSCGLDKLLNP